MPQVNAWQALQNGNTAIAPAWLVIIVGILAIAILGYIVVQLLRDWWQDRGR